MTQVRTSRPPTSSSRIPLPPSRQRRKSTAWRLRRCRSGPAHLWRVPTPDVRLCTCRRSSSAGERSASGSTAATRPSPSASCRQSSAPRRPRTSSVSAWMLSLTSMPRASCIATSSPGTSSSPRRAASAWRTSGSPPRMPGRRRPRCRCLSPTTWTPSCWMASTPREWAHPGTRARSRWRAATTTTRWTSMPLAWSWQSSSTRCRRRWSAPSSSIASAAAGSLPALLPSAPRRRISCSRCSAPSRRTALPQGTSRSSCTSWSPSRRSTSRRHRRRRCQASRRRRCLSARSRSQQRRFCRRRFASCRRLIHFGPLLVPRCA
mmetsp:Transcript_50933/g.164887  ORF Transcript_50933/g.164887 Transcript_50933/m.164887 type:complete len:320 (-) Transcript_50933:124-1083(-)